MANMRYQPQGLARANPGNPIASKLTALFPFNGTFRSALSRSGNPVVTAGPTFVQGPAGYYALGNGAGKVVTDLTAQMLGMAGAAPRTVIAEFDMPDASAKRLVLSFGASDAQTGTQFSLGINNQFRQITFEGYNNDLSYFPHGVGGTAARVFLSITYDGNLTVIFRSWSYLYSTRQVVFNTQTSTLLSPLATGNTVPLNLMGGGTYAFTPMISGLYHVSMYGGSVLSDAEIFSIYQNRWQLFYAPEDDDFLGGAAVAVSAPTSSTGTFATTLAAPSMASAGLLTIPGALSPTLAAPTFAASGIAATPPSGTFAASMAAPVMTSTGIVLDAGSFSATMPAPTFAAIGTAAPNVTGTLAFMMPAPTMSAFGFLGGTAPAAPVRPYRWRILRRNFAPLQ